MPIRQTYINGMIPSRQRATILSFDSMMSSTGGRLGPAGARPRRRRLGLRALLPAGAGISVLALPFLALSRRQNAPADTLEPTATTSEPSASIA